MEAMLAEAKKLFKDLGEKDASARLAAIDDFLSSAAFRVCIAGGFSRGKTHLLNMLLDSELFPEDVVPATTVLTEVAWGPQPGIRFMGESGPKDYAPDSASLEKFCAGNEFADARGILRVELPAEFLRPNLVLYDTPGIDDILEERADVAFAALETCDAALVTTSANAPLGLNERQFIQSYLHNRNLAHIALVATFVDQLPPAAAQRQLRNISQAAMALSPQIELWCPISSEATEICRCAGIDAIRGRIKEWAMSPDLARLRRKRALAEVALLLDEAIARQKAMLDNLSGDNAARQAQLRHSEEELSEQSRSWTELQHSFMAGCIALGAELQKTVNGVAQSLREECPQLSAQDFSVKLRDEARQLQDRLCAMAREHIGGDLSQLLRNIQKQYGFTPDIKAPDIISAQPALPHVSGGGAIWEVLDFLDRNVDTALNLLPLRLFQRKIAETIAHKIIRFGKQMLENAGGDTLALSMETDKFCARIDTSIRQAVQSVYEEIAAQIKASQLGWVQRQRDALAADFAARDLAREIARHQANLDRARALRAQIEEEAQ